MSKGYYTADGWIKLMVKLDVPTVEMTNWEPERIASFFAGIQQAQRAIHGLTDESLDDEQPEDNRFVSIIDEMPSDMADAYESFKLAIMRHRLSGWSEITLDNTLFALSQLMDHAKQPLKD